MRTCDVLIVGGGPAGSSCARLLEQHGIDVAVLDKQTFPRQKVCGGWITPAVIDELGIDLQEYARGRVLQPIDGFRVGMIGGRDVATCYEQVVSYGIRRFEFDHFLLDRCHVRKWLGEPFKSMQRDGNGSGADSGSNSGWIVNDDIRARLVIGAGGHFCPVARQLGASTGVGAGSRVVAAQEVEFEMTDDEVCDCPFVGRVPELYFCQDLMGYAWVFRKGNHLNIGLGREDPQNLSRHVRDFCDFLKVRRGASAGLDRQFHGHAYILYGHTVRDWVADGVMLIGDAAGLAYPQSGEGIRPAVESGLLAARAIVAARGDYAAATLRTYVQTLTARLGHPATSDGLARHLPSALKTKLAGTLLATHWFARHVVLDRWFLHRHQAPLQPA